MKILSPQFGTKKLIISIILYTLLISWSCTVKLISSYDEKTDNAVTELHKKVETFFVTLESQEGLPECKYENHQDFYRDVKVSISAIEVRARAIPKNELTIEQIELLNDSLYKLEQLHKIDCLTAELIKPLRILFNTSFTAILKLELAKKRGD